MLLRSMIKLGMQRGLSKKVEEDEEGNVTVSYNRRELLGHTETPVTDGFRILPHSREEKMLKDKRKREEKIKMGKKLIADRVYQEVDWGKRKVLE